MPDDATDPRTTTPGDALPIYVYLRKRTTKQGLTTEEELAGPYWSLWQQRRFPYGELAVGHQVLLLDHWRDEDRFSWELAVAEVQHLHVESKLDAITHIAGMFGLKKGDVADDPYLGGKEDGPGFLVTWRAEGLKRLNLPRPTGLKLARHGWGRYTEAEMGEYLEEAAALVTPIPTEFAEATPQPKPRRVKRTATLKAIPEAVEA
jgi:hypothetical protein